MCTGLSNGHGPHSAAKTLFHLCSTGWFCLQVDKVCAKDGLDCNDGSDELCDDACVSNNFHGRFTMKVRLDTEASKNVHGNIARANPDFHSSCAF